MQAVVVHESLFGNTQRIAEAVAAAMRESCEVTVVRAADATAELVERADLVVFGAPTHGHSLPKPGTRQTAVRSGAPAGVAAAPGIAELLASLRHGGGLATAFDTRLRWPMWLSGAAGRTIARRLIAAGFVLVCPPASFLVKGTAGPLLDGELERAAAWGAEVARRALAMQAPKVAA